VGCGARLNLGTVLVERGADPTLLVFRTAGWSKTSNRGRKLSQHLIFIDDDSANNAKEDAVVQSAAQDRTPSPNKKVIKRSNDIGLKFGVGVGMGNGFIGNRN
jgi:hypothetical protein